MALIHTDEYFREQDRRFRKFFMLIYLQLFIIFAAISLHDLNNFNRDLGFEFNFKSSEPETTFDKVTFEKSTTGYVDCNLIDYFLDDHHQTGRTIIDVSIAEVNDYHIKYTCLLKNSDTSTKQKHNISKAYHLNCW